MKTLRITACLAALAAGARAQQPTAEETVDRLSHSAEQQLASSLEELTKLRDEIATEKLPLAQELTAQEEKLAGLRREHDRVTRLVDEGNLQINSIKTEMKARQDELSYVGNLLDEYARSFESKIHVAEMQTCGKGIAAAKGASENSALTPSQRFERQTDFLRSSAQRLFEVIGGMRFPGVAVDPQGTLVKGQFAVVGPVALFRSNGGLAGLVVPQSGSSNPLIRPLEGAMQLGIGDLVETGRGLLPLDPSRGGALKALVQKTNIIHLFQKGGPIMWPLLVASILAIGTVLERLIFLMNERRKRDPKARERLFADVEKGDLDGAIRGAAGSKDCVVRAMRYALEHRAKSLPNALVYAQAQELKRYRRGIPILDTVITLAPLLGLLGTVTGMMGSFSLIGGDLSAPGTITGGIAEALIATSCGLGIAIVSLLPFNFLNARLEDARHDIESAATQLELLVHPQAAVAPAAELVVDGKEEPVAAGSE